MLHVFPLLTSLFLIGIFAIRCGTDCCSALYSRRMNLNGEIHLPCQWCVILNPNRLNINWHFRRIGGVAP